MMREVEWTESLLVRASPWRGENVGSAILDYAILIAAMPGDHASRP